MNCASAASLGFLGEKEGEWMQSSFVASVLYCLVRRTPRLKLLIFVLSAVSEAFLAGADLSPYCSIRICRMFPY